MKPFFSPLGAVLVCISASAFAGTPDLSSCNVWQQACHYTSSNRESTYDINRVVIHKMEGATAAGGASWFANCNSAASAHYGIDKSNGYCYQCVYEKDVAWHAGEWNTNCNSIGIEHSGWTANNDTSDACYAASAAETRSCITYYGVPWSRSYIIGHNEVPGCPGGGGGGAGCHTDPGVYWNWGYYMNLCAPFINPSYYFGSGTDGWTAGNSSSGLGYTGADWSGSIYADQTGNDMFWYSPPTNYTGGYEASFNVQVYPQSGNSTSHDMQVFWKTGGENFWDASKSSQCASYTAQNGWINVNLACNSIKYAAQNINQLRLDFDNTSKGTRFIVNHVLLQTTPRYWFDDGLDGWTSGNGLTALVSQTGTSWGGIVYADQTGNDGYLFSPRFNFLGAANDFIYVRLYPQSGGAGTHDVKFYWSTTGQDYMSEAKSTAVQTFSGNNQWYELTFDVGQLPNWNGNFITQLRMDVDAVNHSNRWIIEKCYIHHH